MQISASRTYNRQIRGARLAASGFTLLEVLLVMSLVSILTGVVVLGFTGAEILQINVDKLKDRQARNVVHGEGDNR